MPENASKDIVPTFHSKDPNLDILDDEHNIDAEKRPSLLNSSSHRMTLIPSGLEHSSLALADF